MAIYRITPDRERPNGWQILNLFDIPVVVEPSFLFLIGINFLFGIDESGKANIAQTGLWCAVVFFSLLAHEYGHALTAKAMGCDRISISLRFLGGLARHSPTTTGKSLAIIAAGPGAGMLLGALAWWLIRQPWVIESGRAEALGFVLWNLMVVNLFWNVLNLIPIHPLDGGQGLFHLLTYFTDPNSAMLFVARLSMILCIPVALFGVRYGLIFLPIILIQIFMQNMEISRSLGGSR